MRMKKLLLFIPVLIVALVLVACDVENYTDAPVVNLSGEAAPSGSKKCNRSSRFGDGPGFRHVVNCALTASAFPIYTIRCNTIMYGPGGGVVGNAPEESGIDYCNSLTRGNYVGAGDYVGRYWTRTRVSEPWGFKTFPSWCYTGPERAVLVCERGFLKFFGTSTVATLLQMVYEKAGKPRACAGLSPRAWARRKGRNPCVDKALAAWRELPQSDKKEILRATKNLPKALAPQY